MPIKSAGDARHACLALPALAAAATLGAAGCRPREEFTPFEADCRAWCRKGHECSWASVDGGEIPSFDADRSLCVDYCLDEYDLYAVNPGAACEDAFKAGMACLADLSCEDRQKAKRNEPGTPCHEVVAPYFELCPGVFLAPDAPDEDS